MKHSILSTGVPLDSKTSSFPSNPNELVLFIKSSNSSEPNSNEKHFFRTLSLSQISKKLLKTPDYYNQIDYQNDYFLML